ncbi:CRAL-TRIO domain-containing protein [Penicillium diatomitis]|uniref:CRAL-TRIO domain-containing protein n=1 Tax=Penicillium diatomitis TaxID=2819901 RepID=A0A9W9X3N2_9EURO|nr:CRAL-TRIO domain-containing protein [Penicillium diatomitis]KAJ5482940.1 CRAL-TRIO domain-containing protein [Penicillium diatomitis]
MRACSVLRRIAPSAKSCSDYCHRSVFPCTTPLERSARIARSYARQFQPDSTPRVRSYSTRSLPRDESRQASSLWSITFTIITVGGGAWIYNNYFNSPAPISPEILRPSQSQNVSFLGVIDTLSTMPIEPAPGTVGTLTPEQELKLQEFWVLTLKVFGVPVEGLDAKSADTTPKSETDGGQDKKKATSSKRRGWSLFSKGNAEEEEDTKSNHSSSADVTSSLASISINDGDDKHGQSKEFQQALVEMQPEEIRTAFWNMVKQDHPDALLLRFLRARKWDVKKALIMMISTMRWRLQEVHVDDDIMANGEAEALELASSADPAKKKKGEDFLKQMRMGKSYLHGCDKRGRPICVVRARLHKASDQEVDTLERFTVYTIETARLLLAPPVETATIIFDMTGFTLANMDYTPVKFMIKCFEANYPESLGSVLIHKAPWIFSSIWSVIKGWLDPVVAAKIHFTKNRQDLEEFIAPSQIMKELDGDENWEYNYVEVQEGENAKLKDTETRDKLLSERQVLAKDIQDVTMEWLRASSHKDTSAIAAVKGKRDDLIAQLREQYWVLDPYIRARSLYDRLDIVQGDGKIEFYPESVKNGRGNAAAETPSA